MLWFCRRCCVSSHYVVIHEGGSPKQTETPGTAQDTSHYVLSCFLKPMADGVFKLLIPYHWTLNIVNC